MPIIGRKNVSPPVINVRHQHPTSIQQHCRRYMVRLMKLCPEFSEKKMPASMKLMFDINFLYQNKGNMDAAPDETMSMIGWKTASMHEINVRNQNTTSTQPQCGRIFMRLMKICLWFGEKMPASMKSIFDFNSLYQHEVSVDASPDESMPMMGWKNACQQEINVCDINTSAVLMKPC